MWDLLRNNVRKYKLVKYIRINVSPACICHLSVSVSVRVKPSPVARPTATGSRSGGSPHIGHTRFRTWGKGHYWQHSAPRQIGCDVLLSTSELRNQTMRLVLVPAARGMAPCSSAPRCSTPTPFLCSTGTRRSSLHGYLQVSTFAAL